MCSRTCCRPAGAGGAASAPGLPACSGGRTDSTPQTRGSYLPCGHSRPRPGPVRRPCSSIRWKGTEFSRLSLVGQEDPSQARARDPRLLAAGERVPVLGFSPCGAWVPFRAPRGGRTGCWLTVWERVYEDGPANARGRGPGMGPQPTGCSALLSKKRPSPVDSRSRLRLACVWLVRGATSCRPLPPWNPHLRRLGGRRGPPTIHQAVLSPDRPTPRPARRLPPDRASMASTPAPPAAPRCSAAWA